MKLVVLIAILSSLLVWAQSLPAQQNLAFKKWALLVSTSKGWPFYRHEATILQAYHILVNNGFPKENIITLVYDDIANNPRNPEKGVVRNHQFGPNLYPGVRLDYTGKDVNGKIFSAVLNGNKAAVKGIGSERVIESGPRDVIFINIVGVGTPNELAFATGPPTPASVFVNDLVQLRKSRKARKIFIFVDTSHASTLVDQLPRKNKILAIAAGNAGEIVRAVYCDTDKRICYGGNFGAAWAKRMQRLKQLRSGAHETLFNQFQYLRSLTVGTHVGLFGHLELGKGKASEFFGYKLELKKITSGNGFGQMIGTNEIESENVDEFEEYLDENEISDSESENDSDEDSENSFLTDALADFNLNAKNVDSIEDIKVLEEKFKYIL